MSLIRYEPASVLNRLRDQLNRLYDPDYFPSLWDEETTSTSNWIPSVDVREDDEKFVFLADLPGVDPKDIEVTCENGMLTIKGGKKMETREEKEGYKRIERSRGSFFRRFSLPDSADTDKIKANCKNGVLELTIPKIEKVKPRKVEVKV